MILGDIEPRPQQLLEIEFLHDRWRAVVGSAPGKGKTLSAAYAAVPPVTISCPSYMVQKWADWLRIHMPPAVSDHVHVASGSSMDKWARFEAIAAAADDPLRWLIVNHDMLRPETEEYESAGKKRKRIVQERIAGAMRWRMEFPLPPANTAILDEMHWLRGRHAGRAQGAVVHFKRTPRVYGLTATFIYRDPDDAFQQLRILDPDRFTSYNRFIRTWFKLWSDGWKEHIIGIKEPTGFAAMLSEYMIRHDYLPGELPEHSWLDPIEVEPDAMTRRRMTELRRVYRDGEMTYATAIEALQAIDRITASSHAKLGALTGWIDDNRTRFDGTHRGSLILVHYKETADACLEALSQAIPGFKDGATVITGDTPYEKRSGLVEAASNVIGTWGSMSEGIDASHLRLVVPYELDWTFGAEYQGIGRVLRPRVRVQECADEPVLIQPIHLKHSGDVPKARTVAGRKENVQELAMEALRDD